MTKKFILVMLVLLLVVPTVSAFEWDNVQTYDKETKELLVTNALGFGAEIGKVKLNTPLNVEVGLGNQKIAEFTVSSYQDYESAIKNFEVYNRVGMTPMDRELRLKYKTREMVEVEKFKKDCYGYEINGSANCRWVNDKPVMEEQDVWKTVEDYNFKEGQEITIGIWTNVELGDKGEWIFTFFGERATVWAGWTASLNTDLTAYFEFDNATDSWANHDLQNIGSVTFAGAKIGGGANFRGGTKYLNSSINKSSFDFDTGDFTINFWQNGSASGSYAGIISKGRPWNQAGEWEINQRTNDAIQFNTQASGTVIFSPTDVWDGTWHMITIVRRGTGTNEFALYQDGVHTANGTMAGNLSTVSAIADYNIGYNLAQSWAYDGWLDDMGFWKRALTQADITAIYNGGSGLPFTIPAIDDAPEINLDSPANDSSTANNFQRINCSAIDDNAMLNLTLVVDGAEENTIYNTTDGEIALNLSFLKEGLSFGMHNYTCFGYDNNSQQGTNTTYVFNVTAKSPTIDLLSPINNYNTSSTTVILNCSSTDDLAILNTTLFLNGEINETFYNTTDSQILMNVTKSMTGLVDGDYNWTCDSWDNQSFQGTTTERYFTIDSTAPTVTLTAPNKTYHYGVSGRNLTLTWNTSDAGVGVHACWYSYNGTNTTVTCGDNNISFAVHYNMTSLVFYTNDTLNNVGSDSISWDFLLWYFNQTYGSDVIEASRRRFNVTVDTLPGYSVTTYVNYNNTQTLATLDSSGTQTRYYANITSPLVGADTNVSFFWNFTFHNGSYTYIQTNSTNQTVRNFAVDDCTLNSYILYNLTLVDEVLQTAVNATKYNTTIEVDLDVYASGSTTPFAEYSQNYSENNTARICLNSSLGSSSYQVDLHVAYDGDGYAPETFHLQKSTITNDSITQSINLYDLLDDDSQEFKITFKDSNFLAVRDALVQIQRKYVNEGLFKTVEQPLTDAQGETLGHFQLGNIIYNIIISKNGVVLGTFNNILPICQNPTITDCIINLNSFATSISPDSYTTGDDFAYTMSYNKGTRNVGTTYTIPSGTSGTVLLNVTLIDGTGTTSSCTDTVTSPSGTLNCTIPTTSGNGTAIARITRGGDLEGYAMISLEQTPASIYGGSLVLIGLIMIVSIIGIGVSNNPMITAIFGLVGGGMLIAMNLLDTGVGSFIGAGATILWLFIAIVIILIKGSKRI